MKLPKPDQFGNYWLGSHKEGPAIFPHKKLADGEAVKTGKFTALVSPDDGFIRSGNGSRLFFDTAEAALVAIIQFLKPAVGVK